MEINWASALHLVENYQKIKVNKNVKRWTGINQSLYVCEGPAGIHSKQVSSCPQLHMVNNRNHICFCWCSSSSRVYASENTQHLIRISALVRLLFVHEFMSVSLLGAYCSSKSCNDRFFFLFYAELGSVIRAPFLTDRSILITKSSACSKGSALWRPVQPGHGESDTCRPKRRKAGGRWGWQDLTRRWREKLGLTELIVEGY